MGWPRWRRARRLLDKSVSGSKGAGHAEIKAIADRALNLDAKEPQALLVKSALLVTEGKKNENYDLVNGFVAAGTGFVRGVSGGCDGDFNRSEAERGPEEGRSWRR